MDKNRKTTENSNEVSSGGFSFTSFHVYSSNMKIWSHMSNPNWSLENTMLDLRIASKAKESYLRTLRFDNLPISETQSTAGEILTELISWGSMGSQGCKEEQSCLGRAHWAWLNKNWFYIASINNQSKLACNFELIRMNKQIWI